jgi:hypothetical protein
MKKFIRFIIVSLFFVAVIALSSLETLAFKRAGSFEYIASRIWLIWGIVYLLFFTFYILKVLAVDIKKGFIGGGFVIVFISVLSLVKLDTFPTLISGESTIHVMEGLNSW